MGSRPGTAPVGATRPAARGAEAGPRPGRLGPATVLLLAAWIGLAAGFLDLGSVVLKKHLSDDFYRLGEGFPWVIPAAVATLVVLPGAALALVARLRRGGVPLGVAVWLPAFVGSLDVCARLPLAFWGSSLLSAGLATQAARLVGRRRGFLRFA